MKRILIIIIIAMLLTACGIETVEKGKIVYKSYQQAATNTSYGIAIDGSPVIVIGGQPEAWFLVIEGNICGWVTIEVTKEEWGYRNIGDSYIIGCTVRGE